MKKVILSLALISAGLFSSYACTAKASSNAASASTETTAAAPSEEAAADDKAAEGAIKHIDAAYLRKYIWDYKEEPSKFVFKGSRPAILDFYADWCVACKKWEAHIWHNPRFATELADYTLLKIDVTDFDDAHKAIFNELGLVGPPAVLRYPPHGQLAAPQEKIIGELEADAFAAKLAAWRVP